MPSPAPLKPILPAEKKAWSTRKWWEVTIAGVIVISGASYFFLVRPQWERVGAGSEFDIAALQQTESDREDYLANLKQLKDNYNKITPDQIDTVSRVLPNTRAVPELLQQIEAIARGSGTELINVSIADVPDQAAGTVVDPSAPIDPLANDKGLKKLAMQLQVSVASSKTLRQFLDALQTNQRIFDVESFLYAADQQTQSFTVKAYYLPAKP